MTFIVRCTMAFPVVTEVEAETEEQAVEIAKTRFPGNEVSEDWVLEERYWSKEKN